ncbi:glycosyltransferase 87 family protein [Dietzia sp. ANT_WB102]|uniref:glycosyltransferase 87 family protein n=1 Tax=Dietzia sp. ANT_WB102 TaxID=2597345 RepID=UPI0011EFF1DF|nr:glycosyltransferase 87 family protein [Dietzia sp. ANT_WB102]KAA0918161.1 DUF2029 domain-containing protein [Dietzia sp. ANT_WB102]
MRSLPSTYWLRGPLALLALASVVVVLRAPDERTPWWGISQSMLDVHVYRWGAEAVRNSEPLYEGLLWGVNGRFFVPMPFTYPPFSALLFQPLPMLSRPLMAAGWTALTLGLLYLVIRMSLRALDYAPDTVTRQVSLCLALICLSLEPVRTTIWLGQINLVLLALVLADQLLSRDGPGGRASRWRHLAGIGSGLAAGIKLTPAFFWAHWIVTGRWRVAVVSVVTFLATVALGFLVIPSDAARYWSGTVVESGRIAQDSVVANQSMRGVVARVLDVDSAPTIAWLAFAALAALVGLATAALLHRAGHQLLALTLSGMTMSMVSPFSWGHHWVWFIPLFVLTVHYALSARRWSFWLLPPLLWAATAAWVQSFPNPDFPDDRWVAIGLFMLGGDIPPVIFGLITNIYPLVWLATVGLSALLLRRSGAAGARLRDYGTADDSVPRAEDPRRG